jgi:tRNA pseudouridine65 synthase
MIVLTREVEKILSNFTWLPEELTIDYDLTNDDGIIQNAITYFHRLQTTEIELEFNNKPTSRYCLVEAIPETGRMHQLRKHFKHIFHPILGSRPHCNKQNKLWLENFELKGMMLHAHQLILIIP